MKKIFNILCVENVSLAGGIQIEKIDIHCLITGTPKIIDGKIVNAVLVLPPFGGNGEALHRIWSGEVSSVIVEGGPIDTESNYVIVVDALGLGKNTSKPSTMPELTEYSIEDLADTTVRMVQEELKIEQVALITGASLGAQLCYVIASRYPDFTRCIAPIAATLSIKGDKEGFYGDAYQRFGWMHDQIESLNPLERRDMISNHEDEQVVTVLRNVFTMLVFAIKDYETLSSEQRVFADQLVDNVHVIDVYYRTKMMLAHHILDEIDKIKSRIIIGYMENDIMYSHENVKIVESKFENCQSFGGSHPMGHAGAVMGLNLNPQLAETVKTYLETGN